MCRGQRRMRSISTRLLATLASPAVARRDRRRSARAGPSRAAKTRRNYSTFSRAKSHLFRVQSVTPTNGKALKMAGILDVPKPRVNCAMLPQHVNKAVCFVGRVDKVHPTGKTFTASDGEGKTATVELNEPLEEELSGAVEVIGMVSNKGAIIATTYNLLQEDKGIPFDLELYNEALKVIHDFPQHYPFQVAASG